MLDLFREKILITGAHGFLGRHFVNELISWGIPITNLITPTHAEANFEDSDTCEEYVSKCTTCVHLAAYVGGIGLNMAEPARLFYKNMKMGLEIIRHGIELNKLLLLGTVCSYPKYTRTPFSENDLWEGYPEETNAPYGIAKKALLVYLQACREQYGLNGIYLIPTNLYGPGDNFSPYKSHVIPALIKKFYEAYIYSKPEVIVWGSGAATRDFLYVKDAARALRMALEQYDGKDPVNIGTGIATPIIELAYMIAEIIGYNGKIVFDSSKPDGQPSRQLDTTKAKKLFGFEATTNLYDGLKETINWYIAESNKNG